MAEGKDFNFPIGARGQVVDTYPDTYPKVRKEGYDSKTVVKKPKKTQLTKRGATALAAVVALGGATEATLHPVGKAIEAFQGIHELRGIKYELVNPKYENEILLKRERDVAHQLTEGKQISVNDLVIAVPQGSALNVRFQPETYSDPKHGDNIALRLLPGAMFEIEKAALVRGERIDPADAFSDIWYAINLSRFGLDMPGYISASDLTSTAVNPGGLKTVTVSQRSDNGIAFYSDKNGKHAPLGQIRPPAR